MPAMSMADVLPAQHRHFYPGSDNKPSFQHHRWQVNLHITDKQLLLYGFYGCHRPLVNTQERFLRLVLLVKGRQSPRTLKVRMKAI